MNTYGMAAFEILRRVEDRLILVTIKVDDKPTMMAMKVRGRAVIIPGFKRAAFFVHNSMGNRWRCSEGLCGRRIGDPQRTASKAVASAVESLAKYCHGSEEEFEKRLEGQPHVNTLPIYDPTKGEGE